MWMPRKGFAAENETLHATSTTGGRSNFTRMLVFIGGSRWRPREACRIEHALNQGAQPSTSGISAPTQFPWLAPADNAGRQARQTDRRAAMELSRHTSPLVEEPARVIDCLPPLLNRDVLALQPRPSIE